MSTAATINIQNIATELKQWRFGQGRPQPELIYPKSVFESRPDRNLSLKSLKLRKLLQYGEQNFGINLIYSRDTEPATERAVRRWFLARPGDQARPVAFGEKVALANGRGDSFLRYSRREFGINLAWSKEPVYEWKILGGATGQPVRTGKDVAIFNMNVDGTGGPDGDFLIHLDRSVGCDIGWTTSPSWLDTLTRLAGVVIRDNSWRAAVLAALSV
ncbi:hypothetical protein [Actinoplanes sp. M2I2]|uniref:hypothetical protein n=1 Tax=Actinoplanes sp. M2I2 TaxID=1734444 RepID=UPI00202282EF|nr:hypothetical protein [Actinoplanes sp. M2I2]